MSVTVRLVPCCAEALFARAAADGVLIVADAKRGDIGSTMKAYADAWLGSSSPLGTDSVTLSPYLGFESLRPALDLADENDRGTFVLALTSNPEVRAFSMWARRVWSFR